MSFCRVNQGGYNGQVTDSPTLQLHLTSHEAIFAEVNPETGIGMLQLQVR